MFSACTEQDIEPFGERHEVYFYKYFMDEEAPGTAKADSTDVTFFFAKPTDDHVMAEIVVALAGRPLTKDLHFGLKVVKDMTTATRMNMFWKILILSVRVRFRQELL